MNSHAQKINYQVATRTFKYYIFDWDNNILHMPTRIHLERLGSDGTWHPHSVSTAAFAIIRNNTRKYRPPQGKWELAFTDFQDCIGEGESRFLRDTRIALEKVLQGKTEPGPSFNTLRQTLREGRLFAIVTARGHESLSLQKAVRLFIDMVLTDQEKAEMFANLRGYRACYDNITSFDSDAGELDYYLSLNRYHAVTNPAFQKKLKSAGELQAGAEHAKQFAVQDFVEHVIKLLTRTGESALTQPISVGFSDDDPANIIAVEQHIQQELSQRFPEVKFCVYDTSDPTLTRGRKIIVSGQLDLNLN